ncbi:hypothetical protein NKG94_22605 [Micromonospora sp. M12]
MDAEMERPAPACTETMPSPPPTFSHDVSFGADLIGIVTFVRLSTIWYGSLHVISLGSILNCSQ